MKDAPRLSKTRFVAGLQCSKRLWWTVHEPEARELTEARADGIPQQGVRVGVLARSYVPGGVLIDLPHEDVRGRVEATARALGGGARVVYEATFEADGLHAAIDILERSRAGGLVLTEVKGSGKPKPEHFHDVAFQVHVARGAGLAVRRADVMHLNRACTHPDLSNLFARTSVTRRLGALVRAVPAKAREMRAALKGPLPDVAIGPHCESPRRCPFFDRCHGEVPAHHVGTLFGIGAQATKLVAAGYETILDLPDDFHAAGVRLRQFEAVRSGKMIVERGLAAALRGLRPPVAYLDFETINPAVPAWPGCHPFDAVPVQWSVHRDDGHGLRHHAWLAEGSTDPREPLARALLAACAGARTVCVYSGFEARCIGSLIAALPHLARPLVALRARLRDLLPIVRAHVYHPAFGGSFGLKHVAPALVPSLDYADLDVQDGGAASAALATLLLDPGAMTAAQRRATRRDLLRYCARDTLALARVHARLKRLAARREHAGAALP